MISRVRGIRIAPQRHNLHWLPAPISLPPLHKQPTEREPTGRLSVEFQIRVLWRYRWFLLDWFHYDFLDVFLSWMLAQGGTNESVVVSAALFCLRLVKWGDFDLRGDFKEPDASSSYACTA
jgi:hypothetical protein